MGAQLTELIRCLNVLETRRQGSSGYHLFEAYNSISNNRTLQSDLQQIFGVMQDYYEGGPASFCPRERIDVTTWDSPHHGPHALPPLPAADLRYQHDLALRP